MLDKSIMYSEIFARINNSQCVIVYDLNSLSLLEKIVNRVTAQTDNKVEIWTCNNNYSKEKVVHQISQDEMNIIRELCYLYEFTDKLLLLDDNTIFPSINNYLEHEIVTESEIIDAVLKLG